MFALRHKGDGWYWTGDGWTDKPFEVRRLTRQEAEDRAAAFALQAVDYRKEHVRPVVDVVPLADMLRELRWLSDQGGDSQDPPPDPAYPDGSHSHQARPCSPEDQDSEASLLSSCR